MTKRHNPEERIAVLREAAGVVRWCYRAVFIHNQHTPLLVRITFTFTLSYSYVYIYNDSYSYTHALRNKAFCHAG